MFLAITLQKSTKEMERGGWEGAVLHIYIHVSPLTPLLLENRFYVKQRLECTSLINIFLDTTI